MLLNHSGQFNNLSPKLRKELEAKVESFGKHVRYKFDISNPNPDPTHHNGKILWPHLYTLDPAVFNITDSYEDRGDVSKSKRIALVDGFDEKTGVPNRFKKIKIYDRQKGILNLNLELDEERQYAMFLELHPKLSNGKFSDKTKHQVITRIDENATAEKARAERSIRTKARRVAEDLTDKQVVDFADAMMWDSSQKVVVLRNEIEELAETNPSFFNDLIEGKKVEYQSAVKQALNKKVILFDPADYSFKWASNNQPICHLSVSADKNEVEKMGEWLNSGGDKETKAYEKIKSLIGVPETTEA